MLQPLFATMPSELKEIPRWVCWKGAKVPFEPRKRVKPAKVTEPASWGSFDQAMTAYESGQFSGVGFVLIGDGIAGVDLDHCVTDGAVDPSALKLIEDIGCKYVELSPSGHGLHGFGLAADIKGTKGVMHGINVELYTSGRYLTMTGHVLLNQPLAPLSGFSELALSLRTKSVLPLVVAQEDEIASVTSVSSVTSVASVSSVSSVGELTYPANCMPSGVGQRNKAVFQLARLLKGTMPDASREQLKVAVRKWHTQFVDRLGTKDFDVTWVDFITAWANVEHPHGSVMSDALAVLPEIPSWMGCTSPMPASCLLYLLRKAI
jgi:hypothetical protein